MINRCDTIFLSSYFCSADRLTHHNLSLENKEPKSRKYYALFNKIHDISFLLHHSNYYHTIITKKLKNTCFSGILSQ